METIMFVENNLDVHKTISIKDNISTLKIAQKTVKELWPSAKQITPTYFKSSGLGSPIEVNIKKYSKLNQTESI